MSGKWKVTYDSGRKYNKSWEYKFFWVSKAADGTENAFCKLCRTQVAPRAPRLTDHASRAESICQQSQFSKKHFTYAICKNSKTGRNNTES